MPKPAKKDVTALILAAGSGERLGGVSKAFLEYKGKPLIGHIADLIAPYCSTIIVALQTSDLARTADALQDHNAMLIEGGATRHESVACLLEHCDTEFALLHEVARPFLSAKLIEDVLTAANEHGAAVASVPFENPSSIGEEKNGMLTRTLAKDCMVEIQTPYAFRTEVLKESYTHAAHAGRKAILSDSEIVRRAGFEVKLVTGEAENVKLTHPNDLDLLKG